VKSRVAFTRLYTWSAPFAVRQQSLLSSLSDLKLSFRKNAQSVQHRLAHILCTRCGMLTSVVCPLDHTLCARNIGWQADFILEDFFLLGLQGNVERYVAGTRYIQREPASGEYRSHHQKVWGGFCL